jgi:ABC-type thiamin/hydroxymethylpyrimidine transport system permease subunit
MDVFSWPSIKSEYNFSPLKVLDYWNLMEVMNEKTSEVIGVSFGASGEVNKFLSNLMGTAGAMPVRGLNHFYQENGFLPKIVVCRAGIGIVSECISAQIPMLLVNDSDLEIQFNESIITDLGIGSVLNLDKSKSRDYLAQQIYEISDYRKPKSWPETVHTSSICDILLGGDYYEQT